MAASWRQGREASGAGPAFCRDRRAADRPAAGDWAAARGRGWVVGGCRRSERPLQRCGLPPIGGEGRNARPCGTGNGRLVIRMNSEAGRSGGGKALKAFWKWSVGECWGWLETVMPMSFGTAGEEAGPAEHYRIENSTISSKTTNIDHFSPSVGPCSWCPADPHGSPWKSQRGHRSGAGRQPSAMAATDAEGRVLAGSRPSTCEPSGPAAAAVGSLPAGRGYLAGGRRAGPEGPCPRRPRAVL